MQETWVQSLGREDPLEKGMATHSSILAWRIPWTENPGGLQLLGLQRVGHDWVTNTNPGVEVGLRVGLGEVARGPGGSSGTTNLEYPRHFRVQSLIWKLHLFLFLRKDLLKGTGGLERKTNQCFRSLIIKMHFLFICPGNTSLWLQASWRPKNRGTVSLRLWQVGTEKA